MNEKKIIDMLFEQQTRFDKLQEQMSQEFYKVHSILDAQTVILLRLDQERVFTPLRPPRRRLDYEGQANERIKNLEKEVKYIKIQRTTAPLDLGNALIIFI